MFISSPSNAKANGVCICQQAPAYRALGHENGVGFRADAFKICQSRSCQQTVDSCVTYSIVGRARSRNGRRNRIVQGPEDNRKS